MTVIEHAKGIIMVQYGWPAHHASARQASQHANLKVRDLAAMIVAATADGQPPGYAQHPAPG